MIKCLIMREIVKKITFFVLFLSCVFAGTALQAATYNCKAQTIQDEASYTYDAAGNKNLTWAAFKRSVHDNNRYLFLGGKNSSQALSCGHEKVDGCELYTNVAVLGPHYISKLADYTASNQLGLYRCGGSSMNHYWEKANSKNVGECPNDISKYHKIASTQDGTYFYCKYQVYEANGAKYCRDVCWTGARDPKASGGGGSGDSGGGGGGVSAGTVPDETVGAKGEEEVIQKKKGSNSGVVTGNCPKSQKWDDATKKCLTACTYYSKYPNSVNADYPDETMAAQRLACCKLSIEDATWNGTRCVCQKSGYEWNGDTCVLPASAEVIDLNCTDGAVPNAENTACVCGLNNAVLDETQTKCVCNSGFEPVRTNGVLTACNEPTTKGGITISGTIALDCTGGATLKADSSGCECNVLYAHLSSDGLSCECDYADDDGNCMLAAAYTQSDEDVCKKLGKSVAVWQDGICQCVQEGYIYENGQCIKDAAFEAQQLQEKRDAYTDAKAEEQSLANRTATALTTAATGVGMMEAFQGWSEQKADADAESDMNAYIATMRCSYGNGKSVKAGADEIELPAGDGETMTALKSEYMSLAQSLKERKESLGMAPGIESEEILDKADMGLYDDENVGVTSGSYASLYRAKMLGSEDDQSKIDKDAEKSDKRLKYGSTAAGVGIVGGIVANSLINGNLGKKLKSAVDDGTAGTETRKLLGTEASALDKLKQCLKSAGVTDTDNLTFTNFYPSVFSVNRINCKRDLTALNNQSVIGMFADSTNATDIYNALVAAGFSNVTIAKMVGASGNTEYAIIKKLSESISDVQQQFRDAESKDKTSIASNLGIDLGDLSGFSLGDGLSSVTSLFNGYYNTGDNAGLSGLGDLSSSFDLSSFLPGVN